MKACIKCGELNGNEAATCFRCGTAFSAAGNAYRKTCPQCGQTYQSGVERCADCGVPLKVMSETVASQPIAAGADGEGLLYLSSVLFPLIGVVIGAVFMAAENVQKNVLGRKLLRISLAVFFLELFVGIVVFLLRSCGGA